MRTHFLAPSVFSSQKSRVDVLMPAQHIITVTYEPHSPLWQVYEPHFRGGELGAQRGSVTVKAALLVSTGVFLFGPCFKSEVAFTQRGTEEKVTLALPSVGSQVGPLPT